MCPLRTLRARQQWARRAQARHGTQRASADRGWARCRSRTAPAHAGYRAICVSCEKGRAVSRHAAVISRACRRRSPGRPTAAPRAARAGCPRAAAPRPSATPVAAPPTASWQGCAGGGADACGHAGTGVRSMQGRATGVRGKGGPRTVSGAPARGGKRGRMARARDKFRGKCPSSQGSSTRGWP